MLLIDSRRGVGAGDREIMKIFDDFGVSWVLVLTKLDKLPLAERESVMRDAEAEALGYVSSWPGILATSSEDGLGIGAVRSHIFDLSSEV